MKNFEKRLVSFLLAVTLILGLVPPVTMEARAESTGWEGKTVSILGDSISTYQGVSNNSAYNSTIGGNAVYYTAGRYDIYRADTWWQQVIDALGMELLVNNSWSGSCVLNTRSDTVGAYADRCVQLHNSTTGETPDVILIFLGTNDFSYYSDTWGTAADVDHETLITAGEDGSFTYATPVTTCEAYAIMLHKMQQRYPDAEIYCMNLTARRDPDYTGDDKADVGQPTAVNAELAAVAQKFGCKMIDLENCGIDAASDVFDLYMADKRVHPNAAGMDLISEAVVSALLGKDTDLYDVSFDLTNVTGDGAHAVLPGNAYTATLAENEGFKNMSVTVTMGGEDVTASCYADGTVSIASVTGDVVITAVTTERDPLNFRWEIENGALVSVSTNGNTVNTPTLNSGSVTDGAFADARYKLAQTVVLKHDRLWVMEWKASGDWSAMLMTSTAQSATAGMTFLFRTYNESGLLAFGTYSGGSYHNYGIALAEQGLDMTVSHVYRLENRIASDGSNMVYLIVDGTELGAMNNYYIGGTNNQNQTVDWVSGKDFEFGYMGSTSHPLKNMSMEYLQIFEGGESETEDSKLVPLCQTISLKPDQFVTTSGGEILENEVYAHVIGYELKKGHTLSISDTNYVFSVRKLVDGTYSTLLKEATTASFTATEDMTVGMLIRKPDKSALTDEEIESIVIYDSQYGMVGVPGYAHRFTVEAETIDGGTATTRANIFLPPSYSETGTATRLIIMTNGYHGHLTDSAWNANTADDVALMKHYMEAGYAVLVVDNTDQRTTSTPDIGNPQLISSYWKAYEYVQTNLNVERLFSIHSRSQGTYAAVRLMRERPELVKCAVMTGPVAPFTYHFSIEPAFVAKRFGFDDLTGATYEADKIVGYDPYTDADGIEYSLPPTFWMMSTADATSTVLSLINKVEDHGNDVQSATYTDTDHSGMCRLNTQQCWEDALAYLNGYQNVETEHRFCAWTVTKEASCTESGSMTRKCADCDYTETMELPWTGHNFAGGDDCIVCGHVLADELVETLTPIRGQFSDSTGAWIDSDIYGCVIGYELKKGHTLSINDESYVFAVRILQNGNYDTMVKSATVDSYTATEDVTVAIRIRKPDKSTLTDEELAGIKLYHTLCPDTVAEPAWEIGTIAAASGQNSGNTTRLRTTDYLVLADYSGVTLNTDYTITYFAYDQNNNYLGNGTQTLTGNWLGAGVGITTEEILELYPETEYFRLALRKMDSSALTVDAVADSEIQFYAAGQSIPVPELDVIQEKVMTMKSCQDGAIYGGKVFLLNASGSCTVYSMESKAAIGSFTLDNTAAINPHANSVCFGSTFYAEGDDYPLLYVNVYNNYSSASDRMEGTCCVYRIVETDGTFSSTLVQVIKIGFVEDLDLWKSLENNGDVRPYGNFVVDTTNNRLYAFTMRDAVKQTRFFGFALPTLDAGSYSESYGCNVVTLESGDILTQFDVDYFNYLQGCCYWNGKILSVEGFGAGSSAEPMLRVIDLATQNVENSYALSQAGLTSEPEMISGYGFDGDVYFAAADGVLRKLTLVDYASQEKKTISILGASMSTYTGISNNADTNSTIGDNAVYYTEGRYGVYADDTWWMQAVSDLDLRLLVNNSWSGSSLLYERNGTVGAYVDRCVQLHDDTGDNAGEMPDIIAIQMGTNDFQYYKDTLGTAQIDYDALIADNGDGSYTYATPTTSLEAAAIVMHKISVRYPDAEVYYLNISQRIDGTDELIRSFNADLAAVCQHFGVTIVDIYNSGITQENFDTYIGDGRVHPNCFGMDAYTEAFKKAYLGNHSEQAAYTVDFQLENVEADYGVDKQVLVGKAFTCTLTAPEYYKADVTVTMGGTDITESCYANGVVTIDAVTGDVTISAGAELDHTPVDYRWEFDGTDLVCVSGDNDLTKNAGTTTDGVFSTTRYALETAVILSHTEPWSVEWKCEGTFKNTSSSGARIFTTTDVNAEYNACYIFKSNNSGLIAMGEKTTSGSHNYGIALADHDIDWTQLHTYRLENRVADDGSNMIWLYVDGAEIGPMNNYYVGTTDKNTTSDWLSGKDFIFPYMGTDTHGFNNCSIEYMQVWEGGSDHYHVYTAVVTKPTYTERGYTTYTCECGESFVDDYTDAITLHSYRWELTDNELVSVVTDENAQNTLTLKNGSITDGEFNNVIYSMDGSVHLYHDQPWIIEFKSTGDCARENSTVGGAAMLSSNTVLQSEEGTWFLYKRPNNYLIALCYRDQTVSTQSGIALADHNIDASAEHTYRLENRVAADGSNMVWLYVDGVEIGAMNNLFVSAVDQGETTDFLNGLDWTFDYMGVTNYYLNNCSVEYMQIWEGGHTHSYSAVVTDPTCTEQGYTTYTCGCGESYVSDYTNAVGHIYQGITCTVCGESLAGKTVSILSHSASTYVGVSNDTGANSTIGNNDVYYTEGRHGVYLKDTWWQQTIDALGMQLLVNNSWSGSCVFMPRKGEASVGYGDRAINLHNDHTGEEPDIIFVYLGCNDFAYYQDTFGKAADVDYSALIQDNGDGTFTYATPTTTCEAYAIMLHKVENRYPDAEIFCMTSTARRDPDYEDSYPDVGQPTEYVAELHKVAEYFGLPVVNLENCIPKDAEIFDQYMGDKRAHPNALGMDQITNEVLSVMLGREAEIRHVTSNGAVAEQAVLLGGSYHAEVELQEGYSVVVTMDGEDITDEAYNNGTVSIDEVTGDIAIYSTIQRDPLDFRWEIQEDTLVSAGETENALTLLAGTVTDGIVNEGRFEITTPIILRHDLPWELEWQYAEDWRGVMLSSDPAQQTSGMLYLSRTKGGQLCFGTWTGSQYDNYGVDLSDLDSQTHTFRLVNQIAADGSNMVWLYVDEAEIGPMNNYFIGSKDQSTTSDWVSGKDFVFSYIGIEGHPLNNCAMEYIQVWEGGHTHIYENGICTVCGAEHPKLADYEGKVISILGDSISTFAGYIPTADGFNREHLARYPQDNLLTDVNETWWMQVVAQLDAKLGINDSWRGATLSGAVPVTTGDTGENAAMSNLTRIQNLGSNGTPDVILLYGGTNDLAHVSKVGTFDPATAPTEVDLTTKKWDNLADGFVHTILRMQYYYPDAVIVAMLPTYTASYYTDEKLAQGNAVMAAICEHYGIAYVDLRESGVTAELLPDGIHPGEEGMDMITSAVIDALLSDCSVEPGEHVVYPVSHDLTNVTATLGHWKGVDANGAFVETLNGDDLVVKVTMGGTDITESCYDNGVISISEVTGALVVTAKGRYSLDGHLQQIPENAYNTTNLWEVLEHDEEYYSADGWVVHATGKVKSVTVPVSAGDRIWATSFGAAGENGANMNGIRVTYFSEEGVLETMSADKVYEEFSKNGYLTVPEGAVAVSVPMWAEDGAEMYILTLPAIPTGDNVHLTQSVKLEDDGTYTVKLEVYASEKVALYADAVIRYALAEGLVLTEASEITVHQISGSMDAAAAVWSEVTSEAAVTVAAENGIVDVTGFNLAAQYIADDHPGSKLVITVSGIEATDDVLWNEAMSISTAASGVWADSTQVLPLAKNETVFEDKAYVLDYAEGILLDEQGAVHLDETGMHCFTQAVTRLEMDYGTLNIDSEGVAYTPGSMMWDGYDRFYLFSSDNAGNSWSRISVIPANNVYYEDSFVATSAEDASNGAGIYYTDGKKPDGVDQDVWNAWNGEWESVSDNKPDNAAGGSSDVQGWIEDLAGETGFTGGSAHLVQAMLGQNSNSVPTATFTFTGTGVDIYSFTNNTAGTLLVKVDDIAGDYPTRYIIVDTGVDTAEGYYQVPTISYTGKGHSTYQVTIMVTTAAASDDRFAYYLDGIRIYDPLADSSKDETVENAYGDEMNAVFVSVRELLLSAGSFTGDSGEGNGFVFIDQNEKGTNQIGVYETYGPKSEVYLAKGQAIAFKVGDDVHRVQVGLRSLTGDAVSAVVSYFDETQQTAAQGQITISHTADMYYELVPMNGYVVIRNTGDALLAVTKVKLITSGVPEQISVQVEPVTQIQVLLAVDDFDSLPVMAYSLRRSENSDIEITEPEASPEELAAARVRELVEKLFGSMRRWLREA